MRFFHLALATAMLSGAYAGTTEEPTPTPTPTPTTTSTTTPAATPTTTTTTTPIITPTPSSVCTKFPYDALLPLSTNTAALSWCSKNFPVACTRQVQKKVVERTAELEPEPLPTTLVKRAQKASPAALLAQLEALGKNFASTACACIETPTPC